MGRAMRKSVPAADPDAYVRALTGWRGTCVDALRTAGRKAAALEETVKWGHLVYASNGPVLLIRAEDESVLMAKRAVARAPFDASAQTEALAHKVQQIETMARLAHQDGCFRRELIGYFGGQKSLAGVSQRGCWSGCFPILQ